MTIKDIFDKLTPGHQSQILYGFEHEICQFVEYLPGRYIGVHVDYCQNLKAEQRVGVWSVGIVAKGK